MCGKERRAGRLSHNTQCQVGHNEKGKEAELEESHPGVVDGVELLDGDLDEPVVPAVDPVMGQGHNKKPPEQDAYIQCRAPGQCVSKQFYVHIGLLGRWLVFHPLSLKSGLFQVQPFDELLGVVLEFSAQVGRYDRQRRHDDCFQVDDDKDLSELVHRFLSVCPPKSGAGR
jgi:hypothetical protein